MPLSDPLPIVACEHADPEDGTCRHPKNMTPECHVFACPKISPVVKRVAEIAHDITFAAGDLEMLKHELGEAVHDLGGR